MIRLAVRVSVEHAELVLAELLELAPAGVEQIDLPGPDGGAETVEYAVYGAPGELPELPDLRAAAAGLPVEVSTSEVPDDWAERWKRFHRPVLIEAPGRGDAPEGVGVDGSAKGAPRAHARARVCAPSRHVMPPVPSLRVRPPWEAPSAAEGVREIVIDPGQAFGTGAHATTRLCLELLLSIAALDPWRGPVLDVGAGSGVLAIAAATLGHGPVLALDNDAESVAAVHANAAVNGVAVEARRFDLRREPLPGAHLPGALLPGVHLPGVHLPGAPLPARPASATPPSGGDDERSPGETIVLANLLRPLLLDLSKSIRRPPRHLIASGLLREEAGEVARAFAARLDMRERERRERGEWAALWLTSSTAIL